MNTKITVIILIFISQISYAQWTETDFGIEGKNVRIVYVNENKIFVGTDNYGLFSSENNGESWSSVPEFNNLSVTIIDKTTSNKLLVGTKEAGVFASDDNGTTWNVINSGLPSLNVTMIHQPKSTSFGVFLTLNSASLYDMNATQDGWVKNNSPKNTQEITSVYIYGSSGYSASNNGGGVIISTYNQNGSSWSTWGGALEGRSVRKMLRLDKDKNWNFAPVIFLTDTGVYVNYTDGLNRHQLGDSKSANALLQINDTILVGTDKGVYFTVDSGATWKDANSGAGAENLNVTSLAKDDKYIYAGAINHGTSVWKIERSTIGLTPNQITKSNNPEKFSVYPNPNNGQFTITNVSGNYSVEVYNSVGTLVVAQQNSPSVNLNGAASGVYSVKVVSGNSVSVAKVTVQ